MDAALPEIGTVEVLLAVVAEQVLDVLADEGGGIVARLLEDVGHGGGASELFLALLPPFLLRSCRPLALAHVARPARRSPQLPIRSADQVLLVVHPAVGAVLLEEPVFRRVAP